MFLVRPLVQSEKQRDTIFRSFQRLKNLLKIQEDSLNVAKNFVKIKGIFYIVIALYFFLKVKIKSVTLLKKTVIGNLKNLLKKQTYRERMDR